MLAQAAWLATISVSREVNTGAWRRYQIIFKPTRLWLWLTGHPSDNSHWNHFYKVQSITYLDTGIYVKVFLYTSCGLYTSHLLQPSFFWSNITVGESKKGSLTGRYILYIQRYFSEEIMGCCNSRVNYMLLKTIYLSNCSVSLTTHLTVKLQAPWALHCSWPWPP